MSFHFQLEALRKFRSFQEENLQKELASAQRELEQALTLLADYTMLRKKTEEDMHGDRSQFSTGPQMTVIVRFLDRVTRDIASQNLEVDQARRKCEAVREALLEAMKKRKALDKLKEKGLQKYLATLDEQERKFINEMAINRFMLNHNKG